MTLTGILGPTAGLAMAAAVAAGVALPASAHSLNEIEDRLGERERYFQSFDRKASQFELHDADGGAVKLTDFSDKVVVLLFIYTNCPDVCPLHAERIAEIQATINQTPMKEKVQFVGITTDPENDSSDVLRSYGPAHGIDPVNWVFLTSGADRPTMTRELAERYGHKFTLTDDGYQLHGVVTHVIGREGRWRANFFDLKFDPANLVVFVNALANDAGDELGHAEPSIWHRLLDLF